MAMLLESGMERNEVEEGGGGERERAMEMEEKREREGRREKRKAMKRMKRKERRKEMAEKERMEEEARLNDPEEQRKRLLLEQQEADRILRDRIAFEESERAWILRLQQQQQSQSQVEEGEGGGDNNINNTGTVQQQQQEEDDDDGPPQIIWQGNEIIVKKKKKKVPPPNHNLSQEHGDGSDDDNRPTSNPFPPESLSLAHTNSESATLENVAQQVPNFGTEQDKAHCPFHLKTGACRFGQRCSRVHFYPDKSCTLLIKNMYNGPGLAWEQDEGLEYTDEEVECCFEEFYEDVHTEFLKFGEIVNFKVCKNGSFHLRGNVYIQYKSLDSALLAYNSVNGRYFAGKQVSCKFVNLTRWKVAICGEYMKSGYKTCSHGTACNFIHCFRNPGGDYEWADSDKPPPKYWVKKMAALFGYSDDYETLREHENSSVLKNSSTVPKTDYDRYHSRRSRSREIDQLNSGRSGSRRKQEDERKQRTPDVERNTNFKDNYKRNCRDRTPDTGSEREWLEEEEDRDMHHEHSRKSSFNRNKDDNSRSRGEDSCVDWDTITRDNEKQHGREGRNPRKNRDSWDWSYEAGSDWDRDRKRHRSSQRKRSRHQSRDNSNVTDESESDKDRGEMETQHYSRKSSRHRRSGFQDYCEDHENENDKVDGGWPQREGDRRAHHHERKRSKHHKKLDGFHQGRH